MVAGVTWINFFVSLAATRLSGSRWTASALERLDSDEVIDV